MELEKFNFTDYKENRIKSYLKEEKFLFVFNFGDSSNNIEKSKKKLKNKITTYKVSILSGKKIFRSSIFKNYIHIVEGYFNFVNLISKNIKNGVFEEQVLLTIKLYGKMYLGNIMIKLFSFEQKEIVSTTNKLFNTRINKKSLLLQKHTFIIRNNVI